MNFNLKLCSLFLFLSAFLMVAVFLFLPNYSKAASLSIIPVSGSYEVGKTFSVGLYVSSVDQAMNAMEGVVKFPTDRLEVVSISKTSSVIGLWVQEPSFSNNEGKINIEGVVLNPGFIGASGKILTINFKTKSAGVANVTFSAGSVLANDGLGTNILKNLENANFDIKAVTAKPSDVVDYAGQAPIITSATHPDQTKWYSIMDAKFNWTETGVITSVRLLVDKKPTSVPEVTYTPSINNKEFTNMGDGVWYLHAQQRSSKGWGKIAHYRFQIDTEAPEQFSIKFPDGEKSANPRPAVIFRTTDKTSGVDS